MPSDIRSFFGGSGTPPTPKPAPKKQEGKGRRARKVVDDSDDDERPTTPQKPKASKPKKESPRSKGEATSTSDYFASNPKPTRSEPVHSKKEAQTNTNGTPRSNGRIVPKTESPSRSSSRKKAPTEYVELDSDDDFETLKVDEDDGDDIFNAEYSKAGKNKSDGYVESKQEKKTRDKSAKNGRKLSTSTKDEDDDFEDDDVQMKDADSDDEILLKPAKSTAKSTKAQKKSPVKTSRKRKSTDLDDDDEVIPAKKPRRPSKTKKEEKHDSKEIKDIYAMIPTIRAPTPPPRDENKKFDWKNQSRPNDSEPPPGAGSKDIPIGAENCLGGLTFVFTGQLESLSREDGQSLVKRYGGKVTSGPSGKTSFVVLGNEAGPSKLEKIKSLKLTTINEDGLFELIRRLPANGGDGKAAEKHQEKKAKDEEKIREMAEEIEAEEKRAKAERAKIERAKAAANPQGHGSHITAKPDPKAALDNQLWTVKYAPTSTSMICGNKGQVEKLQTWLRKWRGNANTKFKKAGADGTGVFRAVMIHGPPGIGKTTAAHLVAKLEGYDVIETNASDTRSKKLVEGGLQGVLDTTSLLGYFAGDGKKVEAGKKKIVLVMDEVDGMSAGDRGGVGALAQIAKRTNVPMILICNERRQPKMRPFDGCTFDLQFRKPTTDQVRARLMTICFREGIKMPTPALDALIEGSNADIRRIINMMSTAKLDQQSMDFDQGKAMSKAWEKHVILKPWDIASKIMNPGMFSPSSMATLNDKIELYFNDHEFSSLMLQENYLKTKPTLAARSSGNEQKLKLLELSSNAADSISDGDLIDRMIHGSQQQWSLMPNHAVASFVRPASYMHGNLTERVGFASWLGQNSKQGKLTRFVKEIQGHMRLRASGDRHEVRQQYMPALWNQLVRPLQLDGSDAVDHVIDLMDSYFLTREDWDALVELGLGPMDESQAKLETKTKSTFTRLYNQRSHPLPFMKASNVVAPKKSAKVKPDLEEANEASDDGEEIIGENEVKEDEDEEIDLKKDKYIKAPKKKTAAAKKGAASQKGKKGGVDDDEDDEPDIEEKPKKAKGRAKGKGKA